MQLVYYSSIGGLTPGFMSVVDLDGKGDPLCKEGCGESIWMGDLCTGCPKGATSETPVPDNPFTNQCR